MGSGKETVMRKTVEDVMTKTVVVVSESTPFKEMVELMDEFRVSALPVLDGDRRVIGIVSEADLLLKEERPDGRDVFVGRRRRIERCKAEGLVAAEIMSKPAIVTVPTASLSQTAQLMHREGVKRLPVVDADARLLGIVSRADLLRVFLRSDDEIRGAVVHDVIERTLWIDPRTIEVRVEDGVVTLQGAAERRSLIPIIVELVKEVDGVVGVDDRLTYEIDDQTPHPRFVTPWSLSTSGLRAER
jgi:CBS domain-containing protein